MRDRIDAICDILLGAAYADDFFHDSEKKTIDELLSKLTDGDLPAELAARIASFDPSSFDLEACVALFADDEDDDKVKLLELIAAVHAADDEFDFAEDEYVHRVAEALRIGQEGLTRFTLDFEVEELKEGLEALRQLPPPVPAD